MDQLDFIKHFWSAKGIKRMREQATEWEKELAKDHLLKQLSSQAWWHNSMFPATPEAQTEITSWRPALAT